LRLFPRLCYRGALQEDQALDVAEIRKEWPDLPIILSTGYAELSGGIPPGVDRLPKPFSQTQLSQAIEKVLGSAVPMTPFWPEAFATSICLALALSIPLALSRRRQ
jgi:hypothetical protein